MNIAEEDAKRIQFQHLLIDLAKTKCPSKEKQADFFKQLEDLYHVPGDKRGFRHFYSDIFTSLLYIQKNDPNFGSPEFLLLNLDDLRKNYVPEKNVDNLGSPIDIQNYIRKLYDHVNLEVQRMRYSDQEDYKISQMKAIKSLEDSVQYIETSVCNAQTKLNDNEIQIKVAAESTENAKKEYITILGIFAAIVLAFTGGMIFSSSVLEYMHSVSIYRILLITLVIGFILFNVIYALVWFISKIIGISDKKNHSIHTTTNLIICLLIVLVILGWCFGIVEKRNDNLSVASYTSSTSEYIQVD